MTGDTTGNLAFQTAAGANTITVPNGTGTMAVQGVSTNIVSGTAVASTSGTSIDFTGIPSWVKRVTVLFNGVSTNGASSIQVQIGAGSVDVSGYTGTVTTIANTGTGVAVQLTSAFSITSTGGYQSASTTQNGSLVLTLVGSNIWTASGITGMTGASYAVTSWVGGVKTLSGTLDRVRITTVNGTDIFDAGSINILYE
jgi:hypothetical protein